MKLCETICERRRWIFLASFFFLCALGTSGYLVYIKIFAPRHENAILMRYGQVFFSLEEIDQFRNGTFEPFLQRAPIGVIGRQSANKTCRFTCEKKAPSYAEGLQGSSNKMVSVEDHHQSSNSEGNRGMAERQRNNTTNESIEDKDKGDNIKTAAYNESKSERLRRYTRSTRIGTSTTKFRNKNNNDVDSSNSSRNSSRNSKTKTNEVPVVQSIRESRNTMEDMQLPSTPLMRRATEIRHHGCCVSRQVLVIPNKLTTINNQRVRAVQFRSRRQIYWEDECRQVPNCTGCTCYTEPRYMLAVVVDDDGSPDDAPQQLDDASFEGYRLEMVVVGGCCKCLNMG